ncbi:MAG: FAD:protein FMN transferase [Defluviitaleaceae bacterium]|nr:FAD:protein FMN transferase [Defluviitaleaceae bacterium]
MDKFKNALPVVAATAAAVLLAFVFYPREGRFQEGAVGLFDTYIEFTAYAKNKREFDRFAGVVFGELAKLHELYDIYGDGGNDGLLSLNKNAGVAATGADEAVIELLKFGAYVNKETDGAVNIAIGPVTSLWKKARVEALYDPERAAPPDYGTLAEAAKLTEINGLIINEANGTVFLTKPGMSVDVGALAKGFAAERAMDLAVGAGLKSGLLNAGGNIVAVGKPIERGRNGWIVGVTDPVTRGEGGEPLELIAISGVSVVTSGGSERFFIADGRRYNHIIDPKTLFPAENYLSVTVIHDRSSVAEMLSTALFIFDVAEGEAFAKKHGAQALWVFGDGTVHKTGGWPS